MFLVEILVFLLVPYDVILYVARVGQNCICTPYMTICMVMSLLEIPYIHRIVLANSINNLMDCRWSWTTLPSSAAAASGAGLSSPCRLGARSLPLKSTSKLWMKPLGPP